MKVKILENLVFNGERYLAGREADLPFNTAEHLKARGLVEFAEPQQKADVLKPTAAPKNSGKKAAK